MSKKSSRTRHLWVALLTFVLVIQPLLSSRSLASPQKTTEANLKQVLAQYKETQKKVQALENQIKQYDQQLTATFQNLETIQEQQEKTKQRLNQILVRMYTSGRDQIGLQLLSSKSFSEFLVRLEYVRLIMQNDYQIYKQYQEQANQIRKLQAEIKKKAAEAKPILQEHEQKLKQLSKQYQTLSAKLKKESLQASGISDPNKSSNLSWLNKARAMIGTVQYKFGATNYPYFDCSGWVQYVFRTYRGIQLPRTAAQQATVGTPVSKNQLQPGDLVFFQGTYKAGISHVGIYLGNGYYISNRNEKLDLQIDSLNSSYSKKHYWGARRI